MGSHWWHRSAKTSSPVSCSFIQGGHIWELIWVLHLTISTHLLHSRFFHITYERPHHNKKINLHESFYSQFWLLLLFCLLLLSMCNYVYYTTTTIWNHKQNKNNNNNNLKLTEIAAFSEVINVWLTCPVAQHQMTTCKAGHNVKLLWIWLFWMGSHFRHWSTNSWPAVTDSFNCGGYIWQLICKCHLKIWTQFWGGNLSSKFTIKLNIWNLRS